MSDGFDVVTLGETMLRLTPGTFERLEQADAFHVHVGGSESNTAVGLARLGMSVAWISRLPNHALGQHVRHELAAQGVETRWVRWSDRDRLGLYFYEPGLGARPSQVVYDREGSAFARMQPEDLAEDPFRGASWFHATGISLAVSESSRATMERAREIAFQNRAQLSFDFNHRTKLWTLPEAKAICTPWFEACDVLFLARRDALAWLGLSPEASDEEAIEGIAALRSDRVTVLTLGERGAIGCQGAQCQMVGTQPMEFPAGRLGGGDAFSAGFLFAWHQGWGLETALRWGNAAALLKYSHAGDIPCFNRSEVQQLASGQLSRGAWR